MSKKQESTAETEYVAATEAANQAIWLKRILNEPKVQLLVLMMWSITLI